MNDESVTAHVDRVVDSRRDFYWNKDRIIAIELCCIGLALQVLASWIVSRKYDE